MDGWMDGWKLKHRGEMDIHLRWTDKVRLRGYRQKKKKVLCCEDVEKKDEAHLLQSVHVLCMSPPTYLSLPPSLIFFLLLFLSLNFFFIR